MPSDEREYWQSLEELSGAPGPADELYGAPPNAASEPPRAITRRGFFRIMGLSTAAAAAACQRAPVHKIIPFVTKPEEITPGVPLWYGSTCAACPAACGLLVKTRDGRPIKIEGNPRHPVSRGGVCAAGQAFVLSLYDAARARGPWVGGAPSTWAELDRRVKTGLDAAASAGRAIRVLAPWSLGPTAEAALARLVAARPGTRVVRWDALGDAAAVADAHLATHGARVVPQIRLDRARRVVSFAADFLGTWIDPVALSRGYAEARNPARGAAMLRHHQLEPLMSLTGQNADARAPLAPSEIGPALAHLLLRLLERADTAVRGDLAAAVGRWPAPQKVAPLDALAEELLAARGQAVVLCGSTEVAVQTLVNAANELLGAYRAVLDLAAGRALDPDALGMDALLAELKAGQVGALLVLGVNPVYGHPAGAELGELLPKVPLQVSTADRLDETARVSGLLAPAHHPMESWGDAEPASGVISVRQPSVAPLFETRDLVESLLAWVDAPQEAYAFMRERWEREVFPRRGTLSGFQGFWDGAVQAGFAVVPAAARDATFRPAGVAGPGGAAGEGELELWLHPQVGLRDGALANNAWLQELPDPVTKVTWTNVAAIAPSLAAKLDLADGDRVEVTSNGRQATLPVLVQPGIEPHTVAIAVGYGRGNAGPIGNGQGANAFPLAAVQGGRAVLQGRAKLVGSGGSHPLARTQTHSSQEGRPLVRELPLAAALAGEKVAEGEAEEAASLWSKHEYPGHRWAMAIDLNACTGCSACLVSCQAENNVPVVGEDEVRRRREMHWIRVDRYYVGPAENPRAVSQPMLCQQCENAPCETVCPVLATLHSSEGLNQQVYNRCVGTRYCANNCPPKVRRFNWFEYPHDDPLERMVLNPDVVVRSRGVMEKCSFCVQRIMAAEEQAKAEGRPLADGEVKTACEQSCPAQAIVFGDVNDRKSRVAGLAADPRGYRILAGLGIGPSVVYLAKVRSAGAGGTHG